MDIVCLCRESWNEPDGQCGRDLTVGITCNIPAFLAYYDACAAGLIEADAHLIFGGPASDGKKEFLFALVGHCLNGTNAITGEVGCGAQPSFFNAHLKGSQSSYPITAQELPIAEQVAQMTKVQRVLAHLFPQCSCCKSSIALICDL